MMNTVKMMRSKNISPFIIQLIMLPMILLGCGTDNPFTRGAKFDDDTILPPAGSTISFSEDVVPLLTSCLSCHGSGTGGWTYSGGPTAHTAAVRVINRSSPSNSPLLVKATGGSSHGGGTLFSTSSIEYKTILQWIEQGAQDN